MTRFLLIRHATNDTVGKLLAGRMPGVYLNEEGTAQALQLADRLSGLPIAAIYSSPLERAVETAAPLANRLNLKTIINEDFLEMNFGEWTGCTFDELRTKVDFQKFNTFRSCARVPSGESMMEAKARMINGIEKLTAKHDGQTVAIVSHADMIKATIAYYAGIHLDMFHRLEISPASVSIIEVFEETARILLVNCSGGIKI
jgi:probable phosphoglycerate mutase